MNKDECIELAELIWGGKISVSQMPHFIAFANACEKIGMEKAAKICESQVQEYHPDGEPRRMEYFCAEAIRAHKE